MEARVANHFQKILVPVDFSECSQAALDLALQLAKATSGVVEVLHVWEAPMYAGAEHVLVKNEKGERKTVVELVHEAAERELDGFLSEQDTSVKGHLMTGDPPTVIADQAKRYDLVVMGTHGRGVIARFLLGSVAERLVRTAPCPVLTVRSSETKKH